MRTYLKYISSDEALMVIGPLLAVALILNMLFSSKTPGFRDQRTKFFIYILVAGASLAGLEVLLFHIKNTSVNTRFITTQVFMLIFGIIHVICFYRLFKRFDIKPKQWYKEVLFNLITTVYFMVFMFLAVGYYEEFDYLYYYTSTALFFILPTFIYLLFTQSVGIPAKVYQRWFYPEAGNKYPEAHVNDMKNIILLNLIFRKKPDDKELINFKVKAPRAMDFGRLFYYFINDYNAKHATAQIQYNDSKNNPYGWYYYTKPKWYKASKHINFDDTIDTNNLKDGTTIICQRI